MKFIIPNNDLQSHNQAKVIAKTIVPSIAKGIALKVLQPLKKPAYDSDKPYSDNMPTQIEKDSPLYNSYLGTNILSDLNLKDKESDFQIIVDTALFNVTQNKHIITTPIQGRDGTVKEYISLGDYKISIKGVLSGANGVYPKESKTINNCTVKDMLQMCVINKALRINSWYLTQFNIFDLVITDFTLGQTEGEYSVQYFEIQALSDTPFEINITK
jgi:hypothetical protein